MYSKRKTGAVYGKRRFNKPSAQLWDECMAASPQRPKIQSKQATPVRADAVANSSLDSSSSSTTLSAVASPELILRVANTNIMKPGQAVQPAKFACNESILEPEDLARPAAASILFDAPLTTSTPSQRQATHFRFDSEAESDPDSSLSSHSDPSSDLGDLTDALALTTLAPQDDLQKLLSLCKQTELQSFDTYCTQLLDKFTITKLGEASFSEVFLAESTETQVLKIIPFGDGNDEVPLNNVIQELRITNTMASCRGYVKIMSATIVHGCYPQALLQIWDEWNEKHTSESDRPDWYLASQRYCIIALEHGGIDIEHAIFPSWQAMSACMTQVTQALAAGEEAHGFEHRDLHWGNVLVRDVSCTDASADNITIIDYTLSRAMCADGVACYQFGDRAIFEAEGNDYQFEVYRLMLELVEQDEEGEHWEKAMPRTNVLWLHYLADKLLTAKGLRRPQARKPYSAERLAWQKLERLREALNPRRRYRGSELPLNSAADVLLLLE